MLQAPNITFSKSNPLGELPFRDSISNAGYILKSIETKILYSNSSVVIDTGLMIEENFKGVWAAVYSVPELEERGIIAHQMFDNKYTGEVKIRLYNYGESSYLVNQGSKIARIVYFPLLTIEPKLKV